MFLLVVFVFGLSRCSVLKKTAKQELTNGYYVKKQNNEKSKVYVDMVDETLRVHATESKNKIVTVDTLRDSDRYSSELRGKVNTDFSLVKNSFDIDFLTILFKFRFSEKDVPPQLNTNLNGAVYLGYRTDIYRINYSTSPLNVTKRQVNHFGYSLGFFTGLGNTFMSPTNTNNNLQQEYDGIVWSKGLAATLGVNKFTIGVTLGFDNLLDENKSMWIYENKSWVGLALGLNLN